MLLTKHPNFPICYKKELDISNRYLPETSKVYSDQLVDFILNAPLKGSEVLQHFSFIYRAN